MEQDSTAGREAFERQMEQRRLEEVDKESPQELRRGWCLGGEGFRREMLEQMEGKLGDNYPGQMRQKSGEAKAQRMIGEELAKVGWSQGDLARRHQSDPEKLALGGAFKKRDNAHR